MKNNLTELSNSELINQLENLVAQEKETTTDIIRHLSEVEVRKLYMEMGCSSLFDYATRGLGYSEASAVRRIKVARAAVSVPEICNYIVDDKVSLSAVTACAGVLIKENGKQVLEQLKGKTKEEAEWISASFNPVSSSSVKDKIKKVVIGSAPSPQTNLFTVPEQFPTKSFCNHWEGKSGEKFKISFTANPEFMEKLTRAQELMFSGNPDNLLLENIFGEALDLYIEKHCPKEKQKRRDARAVKQETPTEATELVTTPSKDNTKLATITTPTSTRYIPAPIRDKVLQRDWLLLKQWTLAASDFR